MIYSTFIFLNCQKGMFIFSFKLVFTTFKTTTNPLKWFYFFSQKHTTQYMLLILSNAMFSHMKIETEHICSFVILLCLPKLFAVCLCANV